MKVYYVIRTTQVNDDTVYSWRNRYLSKEKAEKALKDANDWYKQEGFGRSCILVEREENIIVKQNGFLARDLNGDLNFFGSIPVRAYDGEDEDYISHELNHWSSCGSYRYGLCMPTDACPELGWEDKPMEVTITITPRDYNE